MINEMGRTRLDVNVKIKSNVDEKLFALNLVVTIPMPPHTARAELQTSQGVAWPSSNSLNFGKMVIFEVI